MSYPAQFMSRSHLTPSIKKFFLEIVVLIKVKIKEFNEFKELREYSVYP